MKDAYDHWLPKLIKHKTDAGFAITLGQTVYYSCDRESVDDDWRLHEECHRRQWKRLGYVRFSLQYMWYQLKYGYENNPFEIEARNFKGHFMHDAGTLV